jgi:uncharacterized damage-inducible protein DinB
MSKLTPALTLLLACGLPALAQDKPAPAPAPAPVAPTASLVFDRTITGIEREVVPAAEALSEDKFNFAPTAGEFKGVKTFAQQIKHIAVVNYILGAAILGEKPPVAVDKEEMGPDEVKSKAEVVAYLKASYAYVHKAMATLTEQNLLGTVKSPFGPNPVSRLGLATITATHNMDHYGQMVVYLRMNGIIPPASRQ